MVAPKLRVAAAQARTRLLDTSTGLAETERLAREAAAGGAQIVVFPESWLGGYPAWLDVSPEAALWDHAGAKAVFARLHEQAVEIPGEECSRLASLAHELEVALVVGAHERAGNSLYNVLLIFAPDGTLAIHHRKLVPTYSERMVWAQGDAAQLDVAQVHQARLGGLVCWEHWMPLARP